MENATERHKVVLGTWDMAGAKGSSASGTLLGCLPCTHVCTRVLLPQGLCDNNLCLVQRLSPNFCKVYLYATQTAQLHQDGFLEKVSVKVLSVQRINSGREKSMGHGLCGVPEFETLQDM